MPELRFNMLSGNYVIIATDRARRPSEFPAAQVDEGPAPELDPKCPFCPGNEDKTPPEIFTLRGDGSWKVRVVPNKFPALRPLASFHKSEASTITAALEQTPGIGDSAMYWHVPSIGAHEVVVESPRHNGTLGTYSVDEMVSILQVLRDRSLVLYERKETKYVQIFRNWGKLGGASLLHPHFQIMALPVMPPGLATEASRLSEYENKTKRCLLCDMAERELEKDERVVSSTESYVALCPFASAFSYETLILPRKHMSTVFGSTTEDMRNLAEAFTDLFARYETAFSSLSYNVVFHNGHDNFHGHIHVFPRLTVEAGLELGTGVHINPSPPEMAAKHLRSEAQ